MFPALVVHRIVGLNTLQNLPPSKFGGGYALGTVWVFLREREKCWISDFNPTFECSQ